MSKHTPGPWRITHWDVYATADSPKGRGTLRVAKLGIDVEVSGTITSFVSEKELVANARLISAAPELLEALRWYVQFEGYDDESGNIAKGSQREIALKQARAAIVKATGGGS